MNRKKCLGLFFVILTAPFTSGASSQHLEKDDIIVYPDLVYSVVNGHELKLDIAVPKYLKAPAPAIVDIPGGAWRVVNKSVEDAIFYATFGFVGVSITHRTSDVAVFPAAVHDCKTAVRWLRAHAGKYRIDPDKIGVTGFSSGGHLAVLLGTSGGDPFLEGEGGYRDYSSRVQAVVDHFGPTDFMKMNDTQLEDQMDHFAEDSAESLFLGGPLREKAELARLANPIVYIDPKDPPVFIGHGEKDGMVILNQSELLYDALKKAGVAAQLVRVKNADHMYRPYKWDVEVEPTIAEMNRKTIAWFREHLGEPELEPVSSREETKASEEQPAVEMRIFYRLTVDLPGTTEKSYLKGRFRIQCEGKILASGEIHLNGLTTEAGRTFQQDFVLTGADLKGKKIMWNYRGEIFDSELDDTFEIMYMQEETYDPSIQGVGYHIHIDKNNKTGIEKKVFRSLVAQ
jgi:acetyl esterase/lipase